MVDIRGLYWAAGFLEGEGSFMVQRITKLERSMLITLLFVLKFKKSLSKD